MNLNKEELLIGLILPTIFVYWMGFWVVPVALVSSYFWALSGAPGQEKLWRRLGVPVLVALGIYLHTHTNIIFFGILPAFGALSIGYGIPSTQPPDAGSALGRFWFKISQKYASWLTRLTIYGLFAGSFLVLLFG